MASGWKREQKSKDTVLHSKFLTLDDTLGSGVINIVGAIIEKDDFDLMYQVWYDDSYIRTLPHSDGKLIMVSGTKPKGNLGNLKDICEMQMQYELNRATDIMDSPIYKLYNDNIEDVVADQLKDDYYKGINVQNGLEGDVMVYGNGEAPHKRHWKILGFPVVFDIDPE